jgi:site-specific recombinase XerD
MANRSSSELDLSALGESWLIHLQAKNRAAQTLRSYRLALRSFLGWCTEQGIEPVLDRATVAGWQAALLLRGAEPATVRARGTVLRGLSAWLAEEGEIQADKLLGLKSPKVPQKVVEPLTDDEIKRLLKTCASREFRDVRDAAIIRLMVETGMRAGEVIALTTSDIDVRSGWATIRQAKNGKGRKVWFGPKTSAALDRYLRQRRGHRLAGTSALWLGDRGTEFAYGGLRKALAERAKAAGINGFHPHKLRHTFASRWLAAGGSEGGAMAQGGWTQRAMLDRYTQATSEARAAEESRRLCLGDF